MDLQVTYPDGLEFPPVCDSGTVMKVYGLHGSAANFMKGSLAERRAGLTSSRSLLAAERLHLYKYRHLDWHDPKTEHKARSLLVHNRVWAASPQSLNDPQDMGFSVAYTDDKQKRRQWLARYPELLSHLSVEQKRAAEFQIEHGTFTPQMFAAAKSDIDQHTGVYCVSTTPRNSALWAYYGDSHKGFCIQYATYSDPLFLLAKRVRYTDDYPIVNLPTNPEVVQEYYLHKSTDWAHEKEWRIVLPRNNCAIALQPAAVSGVIFGAKAEAKTIETILGLQKERQDLGMPPLTLYKAYFPPSKYGMRVGKFESRGQVPNL